MKIFIVSKKKLWIIFAAIFIIVIGCICHFIINSPRIFATELSCNSIISNEFKDKITNLTKKKEKIAYLTFDDGPTITVTPKILDILKEEDIKATFFVIGKRVEEHPEIVERAYNEGHYIANHGYSHNKEMLYKNEESFINEIKKTDTVIGKAIGVENYCSNVFRFPNGYMCSQNKAQKKEAVKLLSKMNYTYIDWNCLNNDSMKKYKKEQLLQNLKKSCENKNTLVILMHDTKDVSNSALVLKDSIQYLKEKGYKFQNFYDLVY